MTYPPDDREFVPPEWMQLPNDIQLPSSFRMHNLIEKTALFISKHGSQMEILVKAKQAKNPQFDFLEFDSPLNKYYKHLVSSMKSGDYLSNLERQNDSGGSDDEDHYLHPSLLGSAAKVNKSPEKLFLPQLPGVPDENSSYSQLVKSLKDKIIREPEKKPEEDQSGQTGNSNVNNSNDQSANSDSSNSKRDSISILPSPPPEVQLYIDKLAEYVARKGEDFEKTIRKRNEARFEFLNPGNIYHCHYIKRKLHLLDEKRQAQASDIMKSTSVTVDDDSVKGPVSFSLPPRENKKTVLVNDDASPDQLDRRKDKPHQHDSDSDLEDQICSEMSQSSVSKEKQEERRRKAALFLTLLKKKQSEANKTETKEKETDESVQKNGTNRKEDRITDSANISPLNISLSPTIEAVTSPASFSKNKDDSSSDLENSSKERANSESVKPSSSSLLPFKTSDRSKRDKSSSSSPSSSNCSKHSSHHKSHHRHRHHHPHHHHPHHGHHHGHHHHPPALPHHHLGHHKHHRHHHPHHHHHHHHRRRHGGRRRSHSRSRSRSYSRSRSRSRSRSKSRSSSRSRSHSRSPRRKSRKRRCS
ncbi:splicing factor, suppressor of white-apricot homolog [Panonychus citri]|uniref:splicing factor, suppressor of white-apricot homolog n=1 Tax=Panonychus citri TaxID=50023 RepID=UPI002307AD45|nr:splicing factor, suppressor of white-apricot homolog [Panonychus citri]XP_053213351.1 splicing factor, suppressor of white-apricot homolog [Panonychus citri]XP_053213352.1 splicing factor, suppressor of white-apricot homolog [Panonychus citri]